MTDETPTNNPFWGHYRVAKGAAEEHDSTNLEHRNLALKAAVKLIEDIVFPWAEEQKGSESYHEGPTLREIAGLDVWGPRQDAFFNEAFPKLKYDSLSQLQEVLKKADLKDHPNPEKLFEGWAADRALMGATEALDFLKEGKDAVPKQRRLQEAKRIFELLEPSGPEFVGWELAATIEKLAPNFAAEKADEFNRKVREWLKGH